MKNTSRRSAAVSPRQGSAASSGSAGAPKKLSGKTICLETPSSALVLARSGELWQLVHLGPKGAAAEDFAILAQGRRCIDNASGKASLESYPAFGTARGAFGEKRGAMQVTHADGDATLQWTSAAAEEIPEGALSRHVALTLADEKHPGFRVVQHFRAWADCDVFETWVEVRNGEDGPAKLSRMDSFCLQMPGLAERFYMTSLAGYWANEANMAESEVAYGQTAVVGARSGVRDAWENNPAVFVSFGAPAREDCGRVFAGALCWSGAWEMRVRHSQTHELQISAGAANVSGPYVLDAGASIELPKFAFVWSESGKGHASRALHAWARAHVMPHGRALRDVLLNSWEGAYMDFDEKVLTDMMDGVKELGGELFVIDDGWFGRGEFLRSDDTRGLGDWFWSKEKLPKGLSYLCKEARRRGLKLGLWFEPEMGNTRSELLRDHPDWALQVSGRPLRKGRGDDQVVLDMANPAVQDEIFRRIDETIRSAGGLAYIKWDANADIMDAGSPYLGPGKQGNLWFDYTRGVYSLFERLRKAHPQIVFQACSSGGAHCEYGFLGFADEFWGSDNSCAQHRVFIQWGESQFYPASAMAAHVTASPNHPTHRTASLKFRSDVAMSGRLGFELHPKNMTEEEIDFARRGVAAYKRLRAVIQQGSLYRLASPYETDHAALCYVGEDRKRAVAFVYGVGRRDRNGAPETLRIPGLDPARRYRVREINLPKEGEGLHIDVSGKTFGADALAAAGIPFRLDYGDDSLVVEFEAVR